jgi:UDP-glucose 4-epimerase
MADIRKYIDYIRDKTILVTGGTGSFGHVAVANLLKLDPKQIVVLSNDEKEQFDMGNLYNDDRLKFVVGDVRDKEAIDHAMHSVDLVFHAAALKQVPHCEFFPMEAIKTNTIGSDNVINSAIDNGVQRVVVLSTDKAVYPINVMGMSKALMERIMVATAQEKRGNTVLCGTRYGNVMYSRGSVIPFFVDQIRQSKPLTVTNGEMTRFMMSLDESIDLVLYALSQGQAGAIYVRKSPAASIDTLAKAMVSLFSHDKGIKEIGIRPGEKKHETLISSEEMMRTEDCGAYFKIHPEFSKMDYRKYYFEGQKNIDIPAEGYTSANTKQLSETEMQETLLRLKEIPRDIKQLSANR